MWYLLGFFLGVYVPTTLAGLVPEWVHVGLFLMAWLAFGYTKELAALGKRRETVEAEPLPEREAFEMRARFARARREEALRREQWQAWQPATPCRPKVAGMAR
jgi:hypothetical protein